MIIYQKYKSAHHASEPTLCKKTITVEMSLRKNKSKYSVQTKVGELILTQRELDCLYYILFGFTSKLTAKQLCISNRTVEKYIGKIMDKLGCGTRDEILQLVNHSFYSQHN